MKSKSAQAKRDRELKTLAKKIADELFTAGHTTRATRLVMLQEQPDRSERYLGGWCKKAVVDQILSCLRRADFAAGRKMRT